eukprot:39270-Prorocentrum_minimum.AAC.1
MVAHLGVADGVRPLVHGAVPPPPRPPPKQLRRVLPNVDARARGVARGEEARVEEEVALSHLTRITKTNWISNEM